MDRSTPSILHAVLHQTCQPCLPSGPPRAQAGPCRQTAVDHTKPSSTRLSAGARCSSRMPKLSCHAHTTLPNYAIYIYIYIHIFLYIYILPMPYMPCTGIQSRIYMLPMPYRTCTGIQSRIQMPPVPYKRRIRSCRASVSSIVYIEGSLRIRVDVCRFALQMGTILRRCGVAGSAERPAARAWPVLAWWTAAD